MISLWESRTEKKRPKRAAKTERAKSSKQSIDIDYTRYREMGCKGCSLKSKDLQSPQMSPTGSKRPAIYILGEAPGEVEDEQGRQFVGPTGMLLRETLERAVADAGAVKVRWNNCCRCRPPKNRTPLRAEWEHCRRSVVEDIEKTKPRVLIAVGNVALEWATEEQQITKWRGKWTPVKIGKHICWCYPIVHPSFVKRSQDRDGWVTAFRHDLINLLRGVDAGTDDPALESVEKIESGIHHATDENGIRMLARQLKRWQDTKAVVAFDIETTCLRPYAVKDDPSFGWLSIAFSSGNATWAVPISHREANWSPDERRELLELIREFLKSKCVKVAHSLAFDGEWLSYIYNHTSRWGSRKRSRWSRLRWGDTMIQAYVLDERMGGLGLDFLIKQYFGFRLKSQSAVNRAKLADLRLVDLLRYNALDAKYTARLYHAQREAIQREGLSRVYKMHMQRVFTLIRAQQEGLVVDFDCVKKYQQKLGKEVEECTARILDSKEARRYKRKIGKELSPTSANQVAVLFRDVLKCKAGERSSNKSGYSVDDTTLAAIDLPIAKDIMELRGRSKLKSTYVDPCRKGGPLIYLDGRIHTKLNDMFTVTGRLSSSDPNVQNFPKREDAWVRSMIVPPPGHVILSADYGQIEYRVLGIASKDKRICDSLRDRYDVHMDWAERVAKADNKVWRAYKKNIKKLRTEIKNRMVFPAFYGAHADYIASMIGMEIRKCRKLFDEFWDYFSGVHKWQAKLLRSYEERGYVECLSGRRRHAPLSKNMVLNSPIQGSASDIVLDAMNRLSVMADRGDPALQAIMNIHDDLSFYVPRKRQDDVRETIVQEMLQPSYDWVSVPISVEVSVGDNWAAMEPVGTYFSDDL